MVNFTYAYKTDAQDDPRLYLVPSTISDAIALQFLLRGESRLQERSETWTATFGTGETPESIDVPVLRFGVPKKQKSAWGKNRAAKLDRVIDEIEVGPDSAYGAFADSYTTEHSIINTSLTLNITPPYGTIDQRVNK